MSGWNPGSRITAGIGAAALVLNVSIVLSGQMTTADRVSAAAWWPTKGAAARADYVGADACAPCHGSQTATQPSTAMARTAMRADQSQVLRASPRHAFRIGPYSYEIAANGRQVMYTVSDGTRSSSAALSWAFGLGNVGQSFLFERDGGFHEARVSYYDSIHGLGFTPGRAIAAPRDVDEAMARPIAEGELRRCFGCHTTAPTADGAFSASKAVPGITCEACHGPGRRHVDAMKLPPSAARDTAILNPVKLQPEESVDFCGACHATFWDVTLAQDTGISAMRSQPYRLELSRCWKAADARLTCVACHDPHRPLVTTLAAYDDRCLACHVTSGAQPTPARAGRACPVATSRCAECHMPRFDVPEMHHEFTDHRIQLPPHKS